MNIPHASQRGRVGVRMIFKFLQYLACNLRPPAGRGMGSHAKN